MKYQQLYKRLNLFNIYEYSYETIVYETVKTILEN